MRKQMVLIVVAAAFVCVAPRTAFAQTSPTPGTTGTQVNGVSGSRTPTRSLPSADGLPFDPGGADPTATMREAQRARSFASDRQKRMVQDTEKLLALATELKQQMDKTNKEQMSLDVIKKAEEIERLAHDVKIRMKG